MRLISPLTGGTKALSDVSYWPLYLGDQATKRRREPRQCSVERYVPSARLAHHAACTFLPKYRPPTHVSPWRSAFSAPDSAELRRQNTSNALSCHLLDINITPSPYSQCSLLLGRPSLLPPSFLILFAAFAFASFFGQRHLLPLQLNLLSISRRQHSNRAVVTLPHLSPIQKNSI